MVINYEAEEKILIRHSVLHEALLSLNILSDSCSCADLSWNGEAGTFNKLTGTFKGAGSYGGFIFPAVSCVI